MQSRGFESLSVKKKVNRENGLTSEDVSIAQKSFLQ